MILINAQIRATPISTVYRCTHKVAVGRAIMPYMSLTAEKCLCDIINYKCLYHVPSKMIFEFFYSMVVHNILYYICSARKFSLVIIYMLYVDMAF